MRLPLSVMLPFSLCKMTMATRVDKVQKSLTASVGDPAAKRQLPFGPNRIFGGWAADAGNATPTFCFRVPAISKQTTRQWNRCGLRRPKPRNTSSWRLMRRANNNNNSHYYCAYWSCVFNLTCTIKLPHALVFTCHHVNHQCKHQYNDLC